MIKKLSKILISKGNIFLIGKGVNYPTALEGALKLKEISYIHAEALPGGELKHGTLALIDKGTPCIVFSNGDDIISNAQEIKSRGGYIIGVSPKRERIFDFWIRTPNVGPLSPILQIIPIQILAYEISIMKGINPDRPRNLAKSVTVK